ncbi:hypothetical protein MMC30_000460 [Trapelia coarctata]|nr:hypothetical protein [Trapelia coarctata]
MIWGFLVLRCGFSAAGPLLSAVHLLTSPTTTPTRANTAIKAADSLSILVAMMGGYILLSILVALPMPSVISYDQKQIVMVIWQTFPILVSILQYILTETLAFFISRTTSGPTGSSVDHDMEALRFLYSFFMLAAGVTHIHAWSLSLTASILPRLFTPNAAKALRYSNAFVPAATDPSTKNSSFAVGVTLLLQWDEIIGVSAFFLWTLVLYIQAKKQREQPLTLRLFLQLIIGTTIAGPTTGAAALMWARDELVMGYGEIRPEIKKSQ